MKILMTKSWQAPEYLDDAVLHGMRGLFGCEVVDYPRMWFMYKDSFGPDKVDIATICARGFTYYGKLEDHDVDRNDLEKKISSNYFDLVIMHSWYPSDLTPIVMKHMPASKIIWLDGRDERQILTQYIGTGHYFKRELVDSRTDVHPISFAFPTNKIQNTMLKTKALAHVIPGELSTYIYTDEQQYYDQYNMALFGVTRCKNGWDCLRHYEIMGARSVPWFLDIALCPPRICTTLPKQLFLHINSLINQHGPDAFLQKERQQYDDFAMQVHDHFSKYCTTSALAKYIIDTVRI
jgi:hypothetical protein